jgi:hypothetical protein
MKGSPPTFIPFMNDFNAVKLGLGDFNAVKKMHTRPPVDLREQLWGNSVRIRFLMMVFFTRVELDATHACVVGLYYTLPTLLLIKYENRLKLELKKLKLDASDIGKVCAMLLVLLLLRGHVYAQFLGLWEFVPIEGKRRFIFLILVALSVKAFTGLRAYIPNKKIWFCGLLTCNVICLYFYFAALNNYLDSHGSKPFSFSKYFNYDVLLLVELFVFLYFWYFRVEEIYNDREKIH